VCEKVDQLAIDYPVCRGEAGVEEKFSLPFASWVRAEKPAAMLDLLGLLARPGLISFAHVLPAAELFPAEAFGRASVAILAGDPGELQYRLPSAPLKSRVVELMALRGVKCTEEQIFLTAGAQHAMSMLARLLLDVGSSFVVDRTVYDGILVVTQPLEPRLATVPCRPRDGMDVEALASLLAAGERPRFIYVIPDGHNPMGASLPMAARLRLVELSRTYGVSIIEDDPYGLLGFGGGYEPPLRALDAERVLYVGSLSKILAPALRLGWIVAPKSLIPRLSTSRQASDMNVASFTQHAIARLLAEMDVPAHLELLRGEYELRMETMMAALAEHFPAEAVYHRPRGGMFTWVELPGHVDTSLLLREAVEEGVSFIPGVAFAVEPDARTRSSLRLSFSGVRPERIAEGMEKLGRVVRRACG
jgi:2-aminoadipate transaminase